jgi:transposase
MEGYEMLGNESRKLLVAAYEKHGNAKLVASMFEVGIRTVYRLVAQQHDSGSVELRVSQRGRKSKLTEDNIRQIDELLKQKPDITLLDMKEELALNCSEATLSRVVRFKLGYSLKKKVIHASEQERPRCEREAKRLARVCRNTRSKTACILGRERYKH